MAQLGTENLQAGEDRCGVLAASPTGEVNGPMAAIGLGLILVAVPGSSFPRHEPNHTGTNADAVYAAAAA